MIQKCYPDVEQWGIISNGVNFLKNLEEKKRFQWVDSLDKVISSYKFSQNTWRDNFFNFYEVPKIKPSNSDLGQSALRPHSEWEYSFEEGGLLTTFKSLQSKKEEIYKELFKEIFMGFRLSFAPMSGHIFLEMNSGPSSEKGPGFIIPFLERNAIRNSSWTKITSISSSSTISAFGIRNLRIKKETFKILIYLLAFLQLSITFFLCDYIQVKKKNFFLNQLRQESQIQRSQIQLFSAKIEELEKKLIKLRDLDRKIQTYRQP